jgi:hypothetical protein
MIDTVFQTALDKSSKYIGRTGTTHCAAKFRNILEIKLGKEWEDEYLQQILSLIKKRGSDIIWD